MKHFVLLACILVSILVNFSYGQHQKLTIPQGSGMFSLPGGQGHEEKTIQVYYHKPMNFNKHSKILMVIPGSGRKGDSYRDSWVSESERYNVLIVTLSYPKDTYPYKEYHLGGIVTQMNEKEHITFDKKTNQVFLDEEKVEITINDQKHTWIYNDFDRIFDMVVTALGSTQKTYDIFGHSAGGQVLHRFAIFHPMSKANHIIAANSGSYTVPDLQTYFPFGLKNTCIDASNLKTVFSKKLTILVGALDNAEKIKGILLRSKSADKQGLHRLARAHYFFETSKTIADKITSPFHWKLEVVPNVGHNQRKMGDAAAHLLFD